MLAASIAGGDSLGVRYRVNEMRLAYYSALFSFTNLNAGLFSPGFSVVISVSTMAG